MVGVSKDLSIMGVSKDSVHDAWVSVISFHCMTCRILFRNSILYWNVDAKCWVNIACVLRWGVAFVGIFSTGRGSLYMRTTFHVLDIRRWMALIRGCKSEESRFVAL